MINWGQLSKKFVAITALLLASHSVSYVNLANQKYPEIKKVYITSCVNQSSYSTKSKDVRLEDRVKLNLVVESDLDGEKVYFSNSKDIVIAGKKIDKSKIKSGESYDFIIQWYKIEPEGSSYNNWEEGYFINNSPSYKETMIDSGNNWVIDADARPTNKDKDVNDGLGVMRYKAEVFYDGKSFFTQGKDSTNAYGITDKVHRLSFREDDSFTGWLTSFFNLPYIYGSCGKSDEEHQAEKYIGADCADLVVAAYRKLGYKIPYTHVLGLKKHANKIVDEKNLKIKEGTYYDSKKLLKYGRDVQKGDLLFFSDSHVGVLYKDKSDPEGTFKGEADGILNKYDTMIHVYFDNVAQESIEYYGHFSVFRWKK